MLWWQWSLYFIDYSTQPYWMKHKMMYFGQTTRQCLTLQYMSFKKQSSPSFTTDINYQNNMVNEIFNIFASYMYCITLKKYQDKTKFLLNNALIEKAILFIIKIVKNVLGLQVELSDVSLCLSYHCCLFIVS